MNSYAVIFHYTTLDFRNNECQSDNNAVYLYNSREEARTEFNKFCEETLRILEEEGLSPEFSLQSLFDCARISYPCFDGVENIEIFVSEVYL